MGTPYLDVVNPGGASGQILALVQGHESFVGEFSPSTIRVDLADWEHANRGVLLTPGSAQFRARVNRVPATPGAEVPGPNGTLVPAPPPVYPKVDVRVMCEPSAD